jgi:hypothetical protein
MAPQKKTLVIVAAVALLALPSVLQADTYRTSHVSAGVVIGSPGFGVWIGKPVIVPPPCPPPVVHRHVVVGPPWRHRFIRLGSPCPEPVVILPPPPPRPVVIAPAPPVVLERQIEVWVTNSNGSKTKVRLIQRGGRYIGPRGEYYDHMPTNEQLRVVYGF